MSRLFQRTAYSAGRIRRAEVIRGPTGSLPRSRSAPALAAVLSTLGLTAVVYGQVVEPVVIAPTWTEYVDALGVLEARSADADAVATALFRVQNEIGRRRPSSRNRPPCDDEGLASLAPRAEVLGVALRDRLQAARAQARRVDRLAAAPTVAPLVDGRTGHRRAVVTDRVTSSTDMYLEAVAWHEGQVADFIRRCNPPLALAEGLAVPGPSGLDPNPDGERPRVAVIALQGGRICPAGAVTSGVAITDGQACYGDEDCSCEPAVVLPAAVLGPSEGQAPEPSPIASAGSAK